MEHVRRKPTRKPTILDLLMLTIATGIGAAWVRAYLYDSSYLVVRDEARLVLSNRAAGIAVGVLAPWSVALLILHLRHPRARLNHVFRRPGAIACASATLIILLGGLSRRFFLGLRFTFSVPHLWARLDEWLVAVAVAVAASWLTLALGGRWRPEPTWPDRAGRVLGACWLAALIIHHGILIFLL
jgi:hypothetical protein